MNGVSSIHRYEKLKDPALLACCISQQFEGTSIYKNKETCRLGERQT